MIFFINKVYLIRTNIDQHKLQTQNSTTIAQTSLTTFDSFHPVTITQLHIIIKKYCKPIYCALGPIPTSLLHECLENILPTLTHTINTSTLSGKFTTNMKTAILRPLLNNVIYIQTNWKIIDLSQIYHSS